MSLLVQAAPRLIDIQRRAVARRVEEVRELEVLVEVLVSRADGVGCLMRTLNLVLAQVHAVRKSVVAEARSIGCTDEEIAAMIRTHIADFLARYPS